MTPTLLTMILSLLVSPRLYALKPSYEAALMREKPIYQEWKQTGFELRHITTSEMLKDLLPSSTVIAEESKDTGATGILSPNIRKFYLKFHDVTLCDSEIKVLEKEDGSVALLLGDIPKLLEDRLVEPQNWPDLSLVLNQVSIRIENENPKNTLPRFSGTRKCYHDLNGELIPVWRLINDNHGLPEEILADEKEVYSVSRKYFDATAEATVYTINPADGNLSTFQFEINDGFLTNTYFTTNPQGGVPRAEANSEHVFPYSVDDPQFTEISAFAHINDMLKYFATFGYKWTGKSPMTISVNDRPSNTVNNALYTPQDASTSGFPLIQLGNGDGKVLKNLALDTDVVSHELGHHIIYRTVTKTEGESLRLHEGIADFFAFSKTGDSCLGESICPAGSNACVIAEKCLRSGETNLTYGTSDYARLPFHLQGQVISGMLWDLRQSIPPAALTKIVYDSIDLLISSSGFYHFILALLHSELAVSKGSYSCKIVEAATNRGFSTMTEALDCKSQSWPLPATNPTPQKKAEPETKSGTKSVPLCAIAGGHENNKGGLAIFLLSPLLVGFWMRRRFMK